jgi:GNAT superfamily N-acetyltransferase
VLSLRPATRHDVPRILSLIRELATYEREPGAVVATEADLVRDGFGERPHFRVTLADWNGETVGFAFWFYGYSTWRGRPTLYLEDLFVRPAVRGRGIGKALMQFLARTAVENNCGRLLWLVLDWNEDAIRFYESLGAKVLRDWLTVKLDGTALRALAGG